MKVDPPQAAPTIDFAPVDAIEELCNRFKATWSGGESPKIEEFLAQIDGQLRPSAVARLLLVELGVRCGKGEQPVAADYYQRLSEFRSEIDAVFNVTVGPAVEKRANDEDEFATNRCLIVRCPHCQAQVNVSNDQKLDELSCSECHSKFNLVNEPSVTSKPFERWVDHFQLIKQLGAGGFGTVWRAYDTRLQRNVALKLPRKGQLSSADVNLFFREARAAAQLRHPNIVSVHEVGWHNSSIYIVSDVIDGMSMDQWLQSQKPTAREAVKMCIAIARALHHAHEAGIIHRDLKPQNVLIDQMGEPHVTDFGLAKREAGEVTMTMDGQVLGTPAYMSPEQASGNAHDADRRTDVYSLGVVLFQLLTGELPFRGNVRMVLNQVLRDEPPSPRKLNSHVPKDLETICLKCLEKSPLTRYPTIDTLAEDLSRYLRGEPIQARPIGPLQRGWKWAKRNRAKAALIATVFCAAAIISVGSAISTFLMHREQQRTLLQSQRAEQNLDQALDVVDSMLMDVSQDMLMNDVEFTPLRNQLVQRAVDYYEEFLRQHSHDPAFSQRLAEARLRLGEIFDLLDQPENSLSILKDAEQEVSSWDLQDHAELAVMRAKLGLQIANAYQKKGDLEQARSHYQSLVSELESSDLISSDGLKAELATAYNSWGVLEKSVEPDRAHDLYNRGLKIREQLLTNSADVEPQREFAKSLANLAEMELKRGNVADAIEKMERAVRAWEVVVTQSPANLGHQVGLADALRNLALVYADRRDFPKAAKIADRAQAAHDKITAVPLRFTTNRLRTVRLRAYIMSQTRTSKDRVRAVGILRDAATEWDQLIRRGLHFDPQASLEAAECYADLGAILFNSGDVQDGCIYLDKAVACSIGFSRNDQKNQVVDRRRLFKIVQRSLLVRAKLGKLNDSAAMLARVHTAIQDSPKDLVELASIAGRAELAQGNSDIDRGFREEILNLLAASVDKGYRDANRFRQLVEVDGLSWLKEEHKFEELSQRLE